MEASVEFLIEQLKGKGIRPSFQRLRVLEYMHREGGHPTVEDIFRALSPVIPSLSKATIYNTLHIFVAAGLVREVEIDDAQLRYDITLHNHGHFLCERCGTITNFSVDIDPAGVEDMRRFVVRQKNVYFRGLCPNCVETSNHRTKELTV